MRKNKKYSWRKIERKFHGDCYLSGYGLIHNRMVYAVNAWGGEATQLRGGGISPEWQLMELKWLLMELEEYRKNKDEHNIRCKTETKKWIVDELSDPYLKDKLMRKNKKYNWEKVEEEFCGYHLSGYGLIHNKMVHNEMVYAVMIYAVNKWGGETTQVGDGGVSPELLLIELEEYKKNKDEHNIGSKIETKKSIVDEFGDPYLTN